MRYINRLLCPVLLALFALSIYLDKLSQSGGTLKELPLFLIPSGLIALIGFLWPTPMHPPQKGKFAGFIRRVLALAIDGWFLSAVIIITAIPAAYVTQWMATGQWEWAWNNEERFRGILPILIYYSWFAVAFLYYTRRVRAGRATIGQFAMGFRILPAPSGKPDYARRFRYGAFGLCMSPLTVFLALRKRERKKGIFDWDAVSNTRAVSTRAP